MCRKSIHRIKQKNVAITSTITPKSVKNPSSKLYCFQQCIQAFKSPNNPPNITQRIQPSRSTSICLYWRYRIRSLAHFFRSRWRMAAVVSFSPTDDEIDWRLAAEEAVDDVVGVNEVEEGIFDEEDWVTTDARYNCKAKHPSGCSPPNSTKYFPDSSPGQAHWDRWSPSKRVSNLFPSKCQVRLIPFWRARKRRCRRRLPTWEVTATGKLVESMV